MAFDIRPMAAADVGAASEAVLRDDWGDRRRFFEFVVDHPPCRPFVATVGDDVVGTGVGTINGAVGWIGTIFVASDHRRRGLGRGLTNAVIDALEAAGCRTLVLVATEAGRPLYERLGFGLQARYHTVEAPGLADDAAQPAAGEPILRQFRPADLAAMAALDAAATGEDRGHLLRAFASGDSSRVLVGPDRRLRGFVVRAPWGGGATVAPDAEDALRILDARRRAAGPGRRVRAGVLSDNVAGRERLGRIGWSEAWSAPRLVRGAPLDWSPEALWGQFNHALG